MSFAIGDDFTFTTWFNWAGDNDETYMWMYGGSTDGIGINVAGAAGLVDIFQ